MDIRRMKNIILVVLLAANLLLGAILGIRAFEADRLEQQAAEDAADALERMGMTAEVELLRAEHPPLYPAEVEQQEAGDAGFMGTFVPGDAVTQTEDGVNHIHAGAVEGEFYVTDGTPSKSLTAALLALAADLSDAGRGNSRVLDAELGWTAEPASPGYIRLRPTWLVTTDIGGFYVDAMTLGVSAVGN